MIRTMIIDDEENAREGLVLCLEMYCPEIDLISKSDSAESALIIKDIQPDLVLLDFLGEKGLLIPHSLQPE